MLGLTGVLDKLPSFISQVLNSGWLNRRVASTSMNRESSRSHAVFTVALESKVSQLWNLMLYVKYVKYKMF